MTDEALRSPAQQDPVLFERLTPQLALITLNRPEVLNVVNEAMTRRLNECVKAVEADKELRVAIMMGAGERAFCAGADLKEIVAKGGKGEHLFPADGGFAGFATHPRTKPWIAAVHGFALGGGFDLMVACDLIVLAEDAKIGLPEVKRGGVATGGAIYRLPRRIPLNIAREIILTGEPIAPKRAYELGLANQVVPPDQLLAAATRLAERIAVNAPIALRESLAICRVSSECSEAELQDMANAANRVIGASKDAIEGQMAFLERRAPRWTGN